jgi:mannose-6-phosphate isomerase
VDRPLRFHPFLRPMVWGGRRLGDVLGKPLAPHTLYGESWEVSDHPVHRSVAASGPWAGRSLRDLMDDESPSLLGTAATAHAVFPWLIKFLDANDWLSVQVHPDETAVRKLLPGEGSKTEAWFVIDAAAGSQIYAGLLPGVDEARLRAALENGTVADCLHHFTPRPGDCIYLPAGTVHAVGGGVLIAEIQQTSDATFRLFDWNRADHEGKRRTLHIEEAIASIHWDFGPVSPVHVQGFATPEPAPDASRLQTLVRSPYFVLEYFQGSELQVWGGSGRLQAAVILEGAATLESKGQKEEVSRGQTWLLPATMPEVPCRPRGVLKTLRCTLP